MGRKRKSRTSLRSRQDIGFVSPEAVKAIRHDVTAVRQVLIRRKLLRLADLFDSFGQPAKLNRNERAIGPAGGSLLTRDFKSVVANRAIERICRNDVGQHELLECVDAVLQFLELVMRDFGHGSEASFGAGPANPMHAGAPSHRLSENQE